ncbi:MAG: phytoene desaturase family protein [Acidimicrobiales bacterium]
MPTPNAPGAIVVGGGHNGLVCAAYLAKAGIRPLVVEARHQVGGCAGTESACGVRVNICNCDHGMVRTMPIFDELDLGSFGLRYVDLEPGAAILGWDAPGALPLFHDPEQAIEAAERLFPGEGANYRRFLHDATGPAELLIEMAGANPTAPSLLRRAIGRRTPAALTLLAWSRRSVGDVLRSYFTDEGILGPAMAAGPAVWGLGPDTPGTGLGALSLAFKHVVGVGRPIGGSGALTDAIAAAIEHHGGEVRTSTPVRSILCEGERIRGVEVTGPDGETETIEAPLVVIACDPREAIVRYLSDPPASASAFVARWADHEPQEGYEAKIDARLTELPRWRYATDNPLYDDLGFTDRLSPTTMVAPSLAEIDRGHRLMERGEILERPMFYVNMPSVLDDTLAPAGSHVFSLEVLFTPYRFTGGWESRTEPERWLHVAAELFEPGFLDSVAEWRAVTPAHYEREYHLPKGHATSFSGGPLDAILGRQKELTRYATPIDGLFLTGAATFPGAGVWGASGRNAAHTILATG